MIDTRTKASFNGGGEHFQLKNWKVEKQIRMCYGSGNVANSEPMTSHAHGGLAGCRRICISERQRTF